MAGRLPKKKDHRSVAQFGSASGLGPEGRGFESLHSDQFWKVGRAVMQRVANSSFERARWFESSTFRQISVLPWKMIAELVGTRI